MAESTKYISLYQLLNASRNIAHLPRNTLLHGIKPENKSIQDSGSELTLCVKQSDFFKVIRGLGQKKIPLKGVFKEVFEDADHLLECIDLKNKTKFPKSSKESKPYRAHIKAIRQVVDPRHEEKRLGDLLNGLKPSQPFSNFDWDALAKKFREIPGQEETHKPDGLNHPIPRQVLALNWTTTIASKLSDEWQLRNANPETIQLYEMWAERGAQAYGYPGGSDALHAWHTLLKRDSAHYKSRFVFHYVVDKSYESIVCGEIEHLCRASTDFCLMLATKSYAINMESVKSKLENRPTSPSPDIASVMTKNTTGVFSKVDNLKWEEITIRFVSNTTVEIKARELRKKFNYAEMGFADGRSPDKPNNLWRNTLVMLAKGRGELSWQDNILDEKGKDRLQKNISRLRKKLCDFFHISEDPFHPYRKTMSAYQHAARDTEMEHPRYRPVGNKLERIPVASTRFRKPGAYKLKITIITSEDYI